MGKGSNSSPTTLVSASAVLNNLFGFPSKPDLKPPFPTFDPRWTDLLPSTTSSPSISGFPISTTPSVSDDSDDEFFLDDDDLIEKEVEWTECDIIAEDFEEKHDHRKNGGRWYRPSKNWKKEKVNATRFVNAVRFERQLHWRGVAREQTQTRKQNMHNKLPSCGAHLGAPSSSLEQQQLERAIQASLRDTRAAYSRPAPAPAHLHAQAAQQVTVSVPGLSRDSLMRLLTRDITPEDYDLLLLLDSTVPARTLTKDILSSFPSHTHSSSDPAGMCTVCLCEFDHGDTLTTLPCRHVFHRACIERWLGSSSCKCPVDNLPLQ